MRIITIIVIVGGLAVAGFIWKPWQRTEVQSTVAEEGYYAVGRGDLSMTLTERGTLKTQEAQAVRSQISGRARIEWLVDEGSNVEAGQVLVELDKTDLEKEIEDLDNKVIQLESELKAADTEVTIQEAQNLTDTEKANLELEVAGVSLKKYEEGDVPQERRRLSLAIDKAQTDVNRMEFRFKTLPEMLEKDFITQEQFLDEELKRKTAKQDLESAQQSLALYEQYQYPLELKEMKAAVTEAERNVDRATKQAEARLEGKRALARQKKRSLEAANERLARANEDMNHMTLRAKQGGIVFYGDPDDARRAEEIKVGAEVWPNRNILTIPDPTRMMAVIKIHESDISKVRVGAAATIRSELDRNGNFPGSVLRIDSVANAGNRRWGDNVRRFNVEIELAATSVSLKPGTSAEVDLDLGTVTDVLFVPLQAVHPRDGRFYVYKRSEKKPIRTRVKLGRANDKFVEVVEGLAENDQVLLYAPEPGEAEIPEEVIEEEEEESQEGIAVPAVAEGAEPGYGGGTMPSGAKRPDFSGGKGGGPSDGRRMRPGGEKRDPSARRGERPSRGSRGGSGDGERRRPEGTRGSGRPGG